MKEKQQARDRRSPATPMPIQNWLQIRPPVMAGPTRNWPAEPPAMPNIWVAPTRVAAAMAGKWLVAI